MLFHYFLFIYFRLTFRRPTKIMKYTKSSHICDVVPHVHEIKMHDNKYPSSLGNITTQKTFSLSRILRCVCVSVWLHGHWVKLLYVVAAVASNNKLPLALCLFSSKTAQVKPLTDYENDDNYRPPIIAHIFRLTIHTQPKYTKIIEKYLFTNRQ